MNIIFLFSFHFYTEIGMFWGFNMRKLRGLRNNSQNLLSQAAFLKFWKLLQLERLILQFGPVLGNQCELKFCSLYKQMFWVNVLFGCRESVGKENSKKFWIPGFIILVVEMKKTLTAKLFLFIIIFFLLLKKLNIGKKD